MTSIQENAPRKLKYNYYDVYNEHLLAILQYLHRRN